MNKVILTDLVACGVILLGARLGVEHTYQAKISKVVDGDTVVLSHDGRTVKCRLYGIDAPELGQPFGKAAKNYLTELLKNQTVEYQVKAKDLYRRSICIIKITKHNNPIVANEQMARSGMAWAYPKFLKNSQDTNTYTQLQNKAAKSGLGLWQLPNPEPPWEYRKVRKNKAPPPSRNTY